MGRGGESVDDFNSQNRPNVHVHHQKQEKEKKTPVVVGTLVTISMRKIVIHTIGNKIRRHDSKVDTEYVCANLCSEGVNHGAETQRSEDRWTHGSPGLCPHLSAILWVSTLHGDRF